MGTLRYKPLLGAFILLFSLLVGCQPEKIENQKTYLTNKVEAVDTSKTSKHAKIYCLQDKTNSVYCSWHKKYLKKYAKNKKKFGAKASQEICYANFITERYGCFTAAELTPYLKKQHDGPLLPPSGSPAIPPSNDTPSNIFDEIMSGENPDRDQFITCLEDKGFIFKKGNQFASLDDVKEWQKKCGSTPAGGHETESDVSQVRDSAYNASADRDQRANETVANGDKFVEAACKEGKNDWLLPQGVVLACIASAPCMGFLATIGAAIIAAIVADDAVEATDRATAATAAATRLAALQSSCDDGNHWACDQRDCFLGDPQACARVDANEYDDPAPEPEPEPEPDDPMPCGDGDDDDCDNEPEPEPLPCGDDPDCEEDSTPTPDPDPDHEPAPGNDNGSSLLPPGGSGSCEAIAGRWALIKGYCESVQWQGDFCDSVMDMFSPRQCADDTTSTPTPGNDETCSDSMTSREHQEAVCRRRGGLILPDNNGSVDRCDFGNEEIPAMDLCSNPYIQWDRERGCVGGQPN